jgi:N-acyl-phosphatidylethanolamine-hydrolysing phospholipase D
VTGAAGAAPRTLARGTRRPPVRVRAVLLATCCAALALCACSSVNRHYDPARPHHTPTGFRNLYPYQQPTQGDFLRWQWERLISGGTPPPAGGYESLATVPADVAALRANRTDTTVTWLGHATLLVQVAGLNLLTDPQFSARASPVSFAGPQRRIPLPLALADLPHIDVVLISHNHYDHLDRPTVLALAAQPGGAPRFLVPLGVDDWMRDQGIATVTAMDWWDVQRVGDVAIHFAPAHHWSARALGDRFATLWGSFVIERLPAPAYRIFFAGDTGYSPIFARDIPARFGPIDFAALPIGAYEPRWFMHNQHVDPAEAVRIHREIGSRQSLGIHWGTFELTDEPLDQPPRDLAAALRAQEVSAERFWLVKPGETRTLQHVKR